MSRVMLTVALLAVAGMAWANTGTTPTGTTNNTPTQVQTQNPTQNWTPGQNWTTNQNPNYTPNYTRQMQKWADEFNMKNVNKDGKLTWTEFKGNVTNVKQVARLQQIFKAMDTKSFGYVTIEQYQNYWLKLYKKNNPNTKVAK
jgi:hypothetical protein